jgi:hypothetical protein
MLEKKRVLGCPTGLEPVTSGITIRFWAYAAHSVARKSLKMQRAATPKDGRLRQDRCKNRCEVQA